MAEVQTLDYSVLSRRRNDLFGISIVSIVIFHYCLLSKLGAAKVFVALVGSVGVPIFLILSGMGLFFSMSKNPSLKDFYKKRLVRVLIPYAIVASVHFLIEAVILGKGDIIGFLRGIFFVDFFTKGDSQFWFIAFILIMYIFFPLLFKLFQSGKYNFLKLVILICAAVGLNFALSRVAPQLYDNIEVMLTRIPAFVCGVYIGEKVYNKRAVQIPFWIITFLGGMAFLYLSILKRVAGGKPPPHPAALRRNGVCAAVNDGLGNYFGCHSQRHLLKNLRLFRRHELRALYGACIAAHDYGQNRLPAEKCAVLRGDGGGGNSHLLLLAKI